MSSAVRQTLGRGVFRGRWTALAIAVLFASPGVLLAQAPDTFDPGVSDLVRALAVQPDGRIVIGGSFTTAGGGGTGTTPRNRLARLHPDGSLDLSFNPGANQFVLSLAVQADGKILVGGGFSGLGGGTGSTPRSGLGRLNPDGSVDSTFNPGTNGGVAAIVVQPDGNILVSGDFTAIGGGGSGSTVRRRLARLTSTGAVDPTFDPGANAGVYAMALQTDGSVVVAGWFTAIGGGTGTTSRKHLARITSTGLVDAVFDPGADNTDVFAIAVQADGKILLGGGFTAVGGGTGTTPRSHLARLNADGSVDAFNPGASGAIFALAIQADGRVIVAGDSPMFLGGGGSGTVSRFGLGRLNPDGSLDPAFDPGIDGPLASLLALEADGRLIVAGIFTGIGGGTGTTARNGIARLVPSEPAEQQLVLSSANTVVTWMRGGSAPELSRAEFSWTTDGINYTSLGAGSRVSGGWQLTGLSLPASPTLRVRARGSYATGMFTRSESVVGQWISGAGSDSIVNGRFDSGATAWGVFALPDASGMTFNVSGGMFQFFRTGTQAVVLQSTGVALAAPVPITVQFRLGNSDAVRKRISVLVHDADFSDLAVCTFWLPPQAPLRPYAITTHTTEAWTNATVSFYAASVGGGGFYQLDDVSMHVAAGTSTETTCGDPWSATPAAGAPGPSIVANGDFGAGLAPWALFGQISGAVTGGVFEFVKLAGQPAGVVVQPTSQAMTTGQILTATFDLGNSSAVRKRVTVILHDNDFSDLSACTFWLAPGQPLATYTYRSYTTKPWTNATVSVYPATVGSDPWIRLDNVTFQRTPGATSIGTLCIEPGGVVPDEP